MEKGKALLALKFYLNIYFPKSWHTDAGQLRVSVASETSQYVGSSGFPGFPTQIHPKATFINNQNNWVWSEGAIRFVHVPPRTLCYASKLDMPSMNLRDIDLEYDTTVKSGSFALGHMIHKMLGICPQVLLCALPPSALTPRERGSRKCLRSLLLGFTYPDRSARGFKS